MAHVGKLILSILQHIIIVSMAYFVQFNTTIYIQAVQSIPGVVLVAIHVVLPSEVMSDFTSDLV